MISIAHILCPVDFSAPSKVALRSALQLARWYDARVVTTYVAPLALSPTPLGAAPPVTLSAADRREMAEHLDRFVDEAGPDGVDVMRVIRDGLVVEDILDMASTVPADLIVMGTHGRSGFEHLLLGSATERVLRKATCPVLTVREGSGHLPAAPPAPFQQILCAMDFSPASFAAMTHALSLAQESGGRLTVLHVADWPADTSALEVLGPRTPEYERRIVDAARLRLQTAVPDAARSWCEIDERVAFGRPWEAILAEAERADVDLIVIGAHGREGLVRHVLGSTADHVVRAASCPVLVVRDVAPRKADAVGARETTRAE